jgi:UDP-N-acetylmuramoyl-tripeptide--D-alanyl-D-alanine ligase
VNPVLPALTLGDPTGPLAWVAFGVAVAASVPAALRWLRVAQREHYLAGSATRFARRWWTSDPADTVLLAAGAAGVVLAAWWPVAALVPAAVAAAAPRRLSVRGRTSPLVWTRRLRLLAAVWALVDAVVLVVAGVLGAPAPVAGALALLAPLLVDLALLVTAPVERRLTQPYVTTATARLARVAPVVVAVTGSYGKTSTKNHIAHLVAGTRRVVASPASYNNRAGLARAVNEQLSDGTEVFVAEMGTYGPGEIAELCAWCTPQVSVITAIGPVHLERFGDEDRIVAAKAEITCRAATVVLNVDDRRLAALADRLAAAGRLVVRCSRIDNRADVAVVEGDGGLSVFLSGRRAAARVAEGTGAQPGNVACALAVALAVGVPEADAVARLADLPGVPHRLGTARAASGVVVIDDTFNSNPAGARAALAMLAGAAPAGRRALVTPGMVELGPRQAEENRAFAGAATAVVTDVVVVGRTNRRALLEGAAASRPVAVGDRTGAVAWVRAHLGPGDAVLYENDLPDHYP